MTRWVGLIESGRFRDLPLSGERKGVALTHDGMQVGHAIRPMQVTELEGLIAFVEGQSRDGEWIYGAEIIGRAEPALRSLQYEALLLSAAQRQIAELGYEISQDSAGHLRNLITQGAQRLAKGEVPQDNYELEEEPVRAAEATVRVFVTAMTDAAEGKLLTERTFFSAFEKLCPLFPFCE